jgi:hypothetical protein
MLPDRFLLPHRQAGELILVELGLLLQPTRGLRDRRILLRILLLLLQRLDALLAALPDVDASDISAIQGLSASVFPDFGASTTFPK